MDKQKELRKMAEPGPKSRINAIFSLGIIGLIVIAALGIFIFEPRKKDKGTPQITSESQSKRYKNGKYNAVGDYTSPGGSEHIGVTVTLKGDIIEDAEVQSIAQRPNTIKFQGIFKENYKQFVVGKKIDEVKLDKVSGSSLTSQGFNDALEKIKAEART